MGALLTRLSEYERKTNQEMQQRSNPSTESRWSPPADEDS
jgi:hypothetical protein